MGANILTSIALWLVKTVSSLGYGGIVFLMFLESSFFPFPSEIVMIPAGYAASQGAMNIWLVILAGIVGSILGALFNYYLGKSLGRKFLQRWGRYMLLDNEKLAKTEEFFNIHGEITTFIGRLIPVIRQYISFPAGIGKMDLKRFIIYTAFGATIWVCILAFLGYFVGTNQQIISRYLHEITIGLLLTSLIIIIIYTFLKTNKKAKERS